MGFLDFGRKKEEKPIPPELAKLLRESEEERARIKRESEQRIKNAVERLAKMKEEIAEIRRPERVSINIPPTEQNALEYEASKLMEGIEINEERLKALNATDPLAGSISEKLLADRDVLMTRMWEIAERLGWNQSK